MTPMTISLSEEQIAQLRGLSEKTGLTPEDFLQLIVEEVLEQAVKEFQESSAYVLKKNEGM